MLRRETTYRKVELQYQDGQQRKSRQIFASYIRIKLNNALVGMRGFEFDPHTPRLTIWQDTLHFAIKSTNYCMILMDIFLTFLCESLTKSEEADVKFQLGKDRNGFSPSSMRGLVI